jgi:hypothetical protein
LTVGAGNDAGGETAAAVEPCERSGRYWLELEDTFFECDPELGGRITAFGLDGDNLLAGPDIHPHNHGSTFWSSPQSDWGWPPPAELDRAPFRARVAGATVELTSRPSARLGLRFLKRFRLERESRAMVLQYFIENTASEARYAAPWEVSRVHPGGLTFFPGERAVWRSVTSCSPPLTRTAAGATWFAHDPGSFEGEHKLLADGSQGWIAHLAGDALFIKVFPGLAEAEQAPGEAGIEIFAGPLYVEIEQQGAFVRLDAGKILGWTVRWYARRIPPGTDRGVGSRDLLHLAQQTVTAG